MSCTATMCLLPCAGTVWRASSKHVQSRIVTKTILTQLRYQHRIFHLAYPLFPPCLMVGQRQASANNMLGPAGNQHYVCGLQCAGGDGGELQPK